METSPPIPQRGGPDGSPALPQLPPPPLPPTVHATSDQPIPLWHPHHHRASNGSLGSSPMAALPLSNFVSPSMVRAASPGHQVFFPPTPASASSSPLTQLHVGPAGNPVTAAGIQEFTFISPLASTSSSSSSSSSGSPPHLISHAPTLLPMTLPDSASATHSDGTQDSTHQQPQQSPGSYVYSASASPPSRQVKPILRKDVTPTGHQRGVSFILPDDFQAKEAERQRIKALVASGRTSEIVKAKAKLQAETSTIQTPLVDSSYGASTPGAAYPLMSRQQKTAFHPLTTPSGPTSRMGLAATGTPTSVHPHPAYSHLTATDGSSAVAIRLPVPLPSPIRTASPPGINMAALNQQPSPRSPPPSHQQYTTLGQRSATPAAPFTGSHKMVYDFPVVVPPPPASVAAIAAASQAQPASSASSSVRSSPTLTPVSEHHPELPLHMSPHMSPVLGAASTHTSAAALHFAQQATLMSLSRENSREGGSTQSAGAIPSMSLPHAHTHTLTPSHLQQQQQQHSTSNSVPRLSFANMLSAYDPATSSADNTPQSTSATTMTFREGAASAAAATYPRTTGFASMAAEMNGYNYNNNSSSNNHPSHSNNPLVPNPSSSSGGRSSPGGAFHRSSPRSHERDRLVDRIRSSPPGSGPPSPSKLARPLAFSWTAAPSANQSFAKAPWKYITQYLLPHAVRVVRSRRPWRSNTAVFCTALFLFLLYLLLPFGGTPSRPRRTYEHLISGGIGVFSGSSLHHNGAGGGGGGVGNANSDEEPVDLDSESAQAGGGQEKTGLYAWIGLLRGHPNAGGDDDQAMLATMDDAEEDEHAFSALGHPALRECPPTDLSCRIQDIPLHTANGRSAQRVLLVVINAGFVEMALNLICSADMVGSAREEDGMHSASSPPSDTTSTHESNGESPSSNPPTAGLDAWRGGRIPRASWLVACSDAESHEFFLARGIAAVRMNDTSALTVEERGADADRRRQQRERREKERLEAAIAVGADSVVADRPLGPIGSDAASWGDPTHININREKVPLVLSLLELGLDVVLIDADVVFFQPLSTLFDQPAHASTDFQVMYDYPALTQPVFGESMRDCLENVYTNTSMACRLAWEMNGGFFLLQSSPATVHLFTDMVAWLKARPKDHDQDALRAALRTRASEGRLQWRLEDGGLYPPTTTTAAAGKGPSLSYRFLPNLLAPNGGLYFLDGRSSYLAESFLRQVEPAAVHVNWVVGYQRKEALMKQYGWWFVSRSHRPTSASAGVATGNSPFHAQCTSALLAARKDSPLFRAWAIGGGHHQKQIWVHPPANADRIHSPAGVRKLMRPTPLAIAPSASSPSASLLLFSSPKPVSSFSSFPRYREPDADGMGGYDPAAKEHQYTAEQRKVYLEEQEVQLRAQALTWRNWYAATHTGADPTTPATGSGPGASGVSAAIFSSCPGHAALSQTMRFDHFAQYDADEYGMPRLHSLFRHAEQLARRRGIPSVMYTNGDLMYHPTELARTSAAIQSYGFASYLAVGMRRNVDSVHVDAMAADVDRRELDRIRTILLAPGTQEEREQRERDYLNATRTSAPPTAYPLHIDAPSALGYFSRLSLLAKPYRTDAMDYFLWSPGFFDWDVVPSFLLGRIAYDNWLVHYANTRVRAEATHGFGNSVVVDVSGTVDALHINHGAAALDPVPIVDESESASSASSLSSRAATLLTSAPEIRSHFQPNTMVNLRLGGQSSLKGLGRLEAIGWRTVKRGEQIHVVKVRPDSGHIAELYDAAMESAILVHHRPTLMIVTADNAHVPHLRNWIWQTRKACRNGGPRANRPTATKGAADSTTASGSSSSAAQKSGLFVFSAGAEVTAAAKQLGVGVFELAPGSRNAAMLNGPPTSNLQIAGLRARAVALLLEFGFDVVLVPTSTVFKRHPLRVMAERAVIQDGRTGDIRTRRNRRGAERKVEHGRTRNRLVEEQGLNTKPDDDGAAARSFNPVSSGDGLPLGFGMDLIAFQYDSSPFNVSTFGGCVYYRHTPATLKLWRRMLHEILAMVARATLPYQVNLPNLGLDWFLQYELFQNHVAGPDTSAGLVWGAIVLAAGSFSSPALSASEEVRPPSPYSSFPHLPAGSIRDHDLVMANGYWFDRPGGLGVDQAESDLARLKEAGLWEERSQLTNSGVLQPAVESEDPCATGAVDCGTLSSAELDLLLSVCTIDQSILLVPVTPVKAGADVTQSPLYLFLARAIELNFRHLALVSPDAATTRAALGAHAQYGFAVLEGSGSTPTTGPGAPPPRVPLFAMRVHQLLTRGFAVGLINVEAATLFGSPFELYTNREYEVAQAQAQAQSTDTGARSRLNVGGSSSSASAARLRSASSKAATQAYLAGQGLWSSSALSGGTPAMLRPMSDLACDVHGPTLATVSGVSASLNNNSLALTVAGSSTAWTFLSVQPSEQARTLVGRVVQCSSRELNTASVGPGAHAADGSSLNLDCLQHTSDALQADGALAVCAIDPFYFPASSTLFDPPPSPSAGSLGPPSPSPADARALSRAGPWKHVSETGVFPLVVPIKHEAPTSGRVFEWPANWREGLNAAAQAQWSRSPRVVYPVGEKASKLGKQQLLCKQSASAPASELPAAFLFRIRILTYTRARSLRRLLASLRAADFMADSGRIRLEVSVDRPEGETATQNQEAELAAAPTTAEGAAAEEEEDDDVHSQLTDSQRRLRVLSVLKDFRWAHGDLSVTLQAKHIGLVGQWLNGPAPTSDHDLTLVLEDDMEVSPLFYVWLKGAICTYYFERSSAAAAPSAASASSSSTSASRSGREFDSSLYGLSLQKQHYVVGQSATNTRYQFLRFKEEKLKQDQWAERVKAAPPGSPAASEPPPPAVEFAALFDPSSLLGDPLHHPVWRYQLVGTWGLLVFPSHWRNFLAWVRDRRKDNAKVLQAGGGVDELFEPCVPHLESSQWWSAKQQSVWSQWFIRYTWEQGSYCLYPHLPAQSALAVNHREAGANHAGALGARDTLLVDAPPVPTTLQAHLSLSANLRFAFPPLGDAPLFDFHLHRVTVDPIVLAQRKVLFTERQMKAGCAAKDYKPFEN